MPLPVSLAARIAALVPLAEVLPGVLIVNRFPDGGPAYLSPRGCQLLGVTLEEVTAMSSEAYHTQYFNILDDADFVAQVMNLVARNEPGTICTYFQQVRTRAGAPWEWYSVGSTIFERDSQGLPSHLLTFAMPVDPLTDVDAKVERLLEEKVFRRRHAARFEALTRREREVLRQLSLGENVPEIAGATGTSRTTVETHRRNLRAKLGISTSYEQVQFAQAFDLI